MKPGSCTRMILIFAGYLFYKKKFMGVLASAAPFLNIFVCIISPVNGYPRHALPLMAHAPIIITGAYAIKTKISISQKNLQRKKIKILMSPTYSGGKRSAYAGKTGYIR